MNAGNKFTKNSCKCGSGCKSKKCPCVKASIKCLTHCHSSRSCGNKDSILPPPPTTPSLLSHTDADLINKGEWLSDRHMTAANILLRERFPHVAGLMDTLLQYRNEYAHPTHEYVQIFNVGNSHWIAATNIGENTDNTV